MDQYRRGDVDVLHHTKQVKTRKSHRCWGCEREFPAGSSLEANACVEPGEILTSYWCPVCLAIIDGDWEDDGYEFGMIRDGDSKRWEEMRRKVEEAPNV